MASALLYNYSPLTTFNTSSNIQHEYAYIGEDAIFVDTYSVIASKFIAAFTDESGSNNDLRLAASSNVMIDAVDSVSMFVYETNGKIKYFTSSNDVNSVRTDSLMMQSFSSNIDINGTSSNVFVMESGNAGTETAAILIKGTDSFQSVYLNEMRVMSGTTQQHFDTTHSNFRFEKPVALNILNVTQELKANRGVFDNDVFIGNSLYSCNLNLWKDISTTVDQDINKIGYGFQINEKNQLELIKYSRFNDGVDSKSISKKIATFGNNELKFDDLDDSNYLMFDSMGITQSSNNNLSALGTSLWQANADSTIYYMNNFVGINTTTPTCHLDVAGTIAAQALNVSVMNVETIVTESTQIISDERVKENIVDLSLEECLSNIMNLQVFNYNYIKNKDDTTSGFIAQQVATSIPYAVKVKELYGYEDFKVIDTNVILANLVGAVKKLAEKINII